MGCIALTRSFAVLSPLRFNKLMTPAGGYAVEMASEKALIIGDEAFFVSAIAEKCAEYGIETHIVDQVQAGSLGDSQMGGDIDYCIVFGTQIPEVVRGTRVFIFVPLREKDRLSPPPGSRVCYYHDFIGAHAALSPVVTSFLSEASEHKRLTLPGDGLSEYHILHEQDVLAGILKFIFSPKSPIECILINPEPVSLLSVAYQIRSLLPYKIDILFDESREWKDPHLEWDSVLRAQAALGWHPVENYGKDMAHIIDKHFSRPVAYTIPAEAPKHQVVKHTVPEKLHPVAESSVRTRKLTPLKPEKKQEPVFIPVREPTKIKLRMPKLSKLTLPAPKYHVSVPARIALSSLFLAFSLYLFSLIAAGTITALTLRSVAQGGSESLLGAKAAKAALPPAVYLQANVTVLSSVPGVRANNTVKELNSLFTSYILGLKTVSSASEVAESSRLIAKYVLADGDIDIAGYLSTARLDTDALYENLSLLDGSLPIAPPGIIPEKYGQGYKDIKGKLQEARKAALTAKSLLAVAPELLGIGSRRKYAVLFQNNMELRPTGGFIGSFGIVSLENGKLFDIQIYDVYSADGQLKGHVEPPEEIRKYLGEVNWYLRDSNWDPDFPTSARRAEWFLGKTIAQEVNGTIAVNVNTLQDILGALGSIHVADYSEDVTAENIFERAEFHAEVGFFPGSSQKKEFIGSVADAIISELHNLQSDQALSLARAVTKSIDEKNTLISLSDAKSNTTLAALGWNGEIREVPCPDLGGDCTADYTMLVDSNFGINKANYFLRREIAMDMTIHADRSVEHIMKVTYTNTSTSGAWPAGPYKSYSRVYMPIGSEVTTVKVGDKVLRGDEIKEGVEHNRAVAGFLVDVPVNSTVMVEIHYILEGRLSETAPAYTWYWQKQSGTMADPLVVSVNYPLFLEPAIVSPQGNLNTQQLQFNLSNVTDRRITVKFR